MTEWVEVGTTADLRAARNKLVVTVGDTDILVLGHEDAVYAFANKCAHRDRELHKGVVLNGRLICPGHQWAFALGTGWEAIKETCQPVYDVQVTDDRISVSREPRPGCNA